MSNNSIWTIDRTLSGATILSQSVPWIDGNKQVFRILKDPALLEPHRQII